MAMSVVGTAVAICVADCREKTMAWLRGSGSDAPVRLDNVHEYRAVVDEASEPS